MYHSNSNGFFSKERGERERKGGELEFAQGGSKKQGEKTHNRKERFSSFAIEKLWQTVLEICDRF